MVKIPTPFTDVQCPLCGARIDRKLSDNALGKHIESQHPTAQLRPLVEMLFNELKLRLPNNIDKLGEKELLKLVENMSQYKATKEGLRHLRRSSK